MQSRKSLFKGRQFTSDVSGIFQPADADQVRLSEAAWMAFCRFRHSARSSG
jgi:hypothetical protein